MIDQKTEKLYDLWEKVQFDKNFEYDYTPDKVEILKDSACANPTSKWGKQYDQCGFSYLYDKEPPDSSFSDPVQTRVILAYLKSHPDDLRDTITEREGDIYEEDDHIAFISGKECELKLGSGRGFTIQTFKQRMLQASNEFNTGCNLFLYLPEQSMTDSEVFSPFKLTGYGPRWVKA